VAKEVIDLGEHEPWNVAGAGLLDGVAKQPMVGGTRHEIVE
jgi:hypothetical protein